MRAAGLSGRLHGRVLLLYFSECRQNAAPRRNPLRPMRTTTTAPAPPHPPQGLIRRRWRNLIVASSMAVALLPAQAQPIGSLNTSVQVTLPNGFLALHSHH